MMFIRAGRGREEGRKRKQPGGSCRTEFCPSGSDLPSWSTLYIHIPAPCILLSDADIELCFRSCGNLKKMKTKHSKTLEYLNLPTHFLLPNPVVLISTENKVHWSPCNKPTFSSRFPLTGTSMVCRSVFCCCDKNA